MGWAIFEFEINVNEREDSHDIDINPSDEAGLAQVQGQPPAHRSAGSPAEVSQ